MFRILAFLLALSCTAAAQLAQSGAGLGTPGFSCVTIQTYCPAIDLNFGLGTYQVNGSPVAIGSAITFANSTGGTDLLPTSASGAAYNTFSAGVPRITPGQGILIEGTAVNSLLNSTAPATQTTGSLGTGTYTLWVNGSGSAKMSAGTATGCGTGTATQGSSITVTITVAGTCTVTVTGSLNAFQLENNSPGTSLIITGASVNNRAGDSVKFTLGAWFSAAHGWWYASGNLSPFSSGIFIEGGASAVLGVTIGANATPNTIRHLQRTGATAAGRGDDNNATAPTITPGNPATGVMTWDGTNNPLNATNGSTVLYTQTAAEADYDTTMNIGTRHNTSSPICFCYIRRVAYGTQIFNQTQVNAASLQ